MIELEKTYLTDLLQKKETNGRIRPRKGLGLIGKVPYYNCRIGLGLPKDQEQLTQQGPKAEKQVQHYWCQLYVVKRYKALNLVIKVTDKVTIGHF